VPLRGRIEAAAAAGFTGFGVLAVDLAVAEREHGLSGIRAMLADNGMVHLELEGLPDWWGAGSERARSDELRRFLLTAAEALSARHLKVTPETAGHRGAPDTGRPSSPCLPGRPPMPGRASASSFCRGRTSRPPRTPCGWSRTPATPPA
jgi:sugar phosphate isomerase/epimerase